MKNTENIDGHYYTPLLKQEGTGTETIPQLFLGKLLQGRRQSFIAHFFCS